MSQLLADFERDWEIGYAPAGSGRHYLRAVLRANRRVIVTAGDAAELRDAILLQAAGA